MGLIVILNVVCLVIAWFFSDEWSLKGKLTLTALFALGWIVPGFFEGTGAPIVFVGWQLLLGLYFVFKLGIASKRAHWA